jgi:hypothetical protein
MLVRPATTYSLSGLAAGRDRLRPTALVLHERRHGGVGNAREPVPVCHVQHPNRGWVRGFLSLGRSSCRPEAISVTSLMR